jgi:hypothetical protein
VTDACQRERRLACAGAPAGWLTLWLSQVQADGTAVRPKLARPAETHTSGSSGQREDAHGTAALVTLPSMEPDTKNLSSTGWKSSAVTKSVCLPACERMRQPTAWMLHALHAVQYQQPAGLNAVTAQRQHPADPVALTTTTFV